MLCNETSPVLTVNCEYAIVSLMSISKAEPEKTRILSDEAMIAAYVHPTRMKILSCLAGVPATLTQTARYLGTPPANLSRHFRKLEAAGLIRLVETKVTDKNIQKYYRAVARSFVIGGAELPQSDKAVVALAILQEELGLAASRGREQAGGEHLVLISSIRILESRRREFMQRLQELIQAFGSEDDPTGEPYTLAGALFPAAASDIGAPNVTIGGLGQADSERGTK